LDQLATAAEWRNRSAKVFVAGLKGLHLALIETRRRQLRLAVSFLQHDFSTSIFRRRDAVRGKGFVKMVIHAQCIDGTPQKAFFTEYSSMLRRPMAQLIVACGVEQWQLASLTRWRLVVRFHSPLSTVRSSQFCNSIVNKGVPGYRDYRYSSHAERLRPLWPCLAHVRSGISSVTQIFPLTDDSLVVAMHSR
jgi:hypothetical protein